MIYGTVSEKGDAHGNLDDLEAAVRKTTKYLREHSEKFDFIAVRGMSGVLVGAPVALRLRKPLVVVRKPGEDQHSYGKLVNGKHATGRYVFLDDFISGGGTRDAVKQALAKCTYAGTYLYHSRPWDNGQTGWVPAPAEAVAA
jgi:adenine/guanine phosphoribosyltransferase-like PRPP-binding protein